MARTNKRKKLINSQSSRYSVSHKILSERRLGLWNKVLNRRMATKNKRKKFINSQSSRKNSINNLDAGVDRISELPDSSILHILSFLPTKLAVSTTVLSKRWNNLWISMPVLDFRERRTILHDITGYGFWECRDRLLEKINWFMDFLDRTLLSNNVTTIRKFCLNFDNEQFDENRAKEWITALIKRKIEEVILTVEPQKPQLVPLEIFSCQTLTMLDIKFFYHHVLDFPESISLPRLKVIRLSGVQFKNKASMQQLLSNSPILEEINLCRCRSRGKDVISFSAPYLKNFTIDDSYDFKVQIDAPNLVFFKLLGRLPTDFPESRFPALVEVDFLYSYPGETSTIDSFTRMCSNIKLLKISYEYLKIFDTADVQSIASLLTLDELMHLEVRYYDPHTSRPLSLKPLFNFLHFSPNLESLVIYQVNSTEKIDDDMIALFRAPRCLLRYLKSIEFSNFNGNPEEIGLVKLILKHARVLQRVIIRRGNAIFSIVEEDFFTKGFIEELPRFPKASKNCSFQVFKKSTKHVRKP